MSTACLTRVIVIKRNSISFSVIIDDSYSDLQVLSTFYMHIKYMIARLLILDLCCLEGYV